MFFASATTPTCGTWLPEPPLFSSIHNLATGRQWGLQHNLINWPNNLLTSHPMAPNSQNGLFQENAFEGLRDT